MMVKVFHYKSSRFIRKIFEENSVLSDPQNIQSVKIMKLDQFLINSLERDFFSPRAQAVIINSKVFPYFSS